MTTTSNTFTLGVSGLPGSGKDTVGKAVMEALGSAYQQLSFAAALKDQLDEVLTIVRSEETTRSATREIRHRMGGISLEHAAWMCGDLWVVGRSDLSLTSRTRSPNIRAALQYWGTEVRRENDPDYWVRIVLDEIREARAQGVNTVVTDVRFPNEAEALIQARVPLVRVEVEENERLRRLAARDGYNPDRETLTSTVETQLSTRYDLFDMVVQNDRRVDDVAASITEHLKR